MKKKAMDGDLFKRITGHHKTVHISIKLVSGINLQESNLWPQRLLNYVKLYYIFNCECSGTCRD